jgi:carbon-monoxide dehydrogenase large subunit
MTTEAQEPTTTAEVSGMGHSMKRKEDPRFIRGKGQYIEDVTLPNMVWMDIVRSPYAHATIKSIDASEALAMPGVLAGCRRWPATSRWCCRSTPSCTRARRSPRSSR